MGSFWFLGYIGIVFRNSLVFCFSRGELGVELARNLWELVSLMIIGRGKIGQKYYSRGLQGYRTVQKSVSFADVLEGERKRLKVESRVPLGLLLRDPRTSELKWVDQKENSYVFDTSGDVSMLNACGVGSSSYQRVGRHVKMHSVYITGFIRLETVLEVPLTNPSYCRVLVVYDRSVNGGTPSWSDVVQTVDSSGSTSSKVLDQINVSNSDRFTVSTGVSIDVS